MVGEGRWEGAGKAGGDSGKQEAWFELQRMFPTLVRSAEVRGSHGAADHGLALIISKGNSPGSILDNAPGPPLCSLLLRLIGHHGQTHLVSTPASLCSQSGHRGGKAFPPGGAPAPLPLSSWLLLVHPVGP